jgi:hypothetical protein
MCWYNRLVEWEPLADRDDEPAESPAAPRRMPTWALSALATLFVLAGMFHSVALYANYREANADHDQVIAMVKGMPTEAAAGAFGPWTIEGENFEERDTISELAPYSRSFAVRHPTLDVTAQVSIDFPFYRKWHDVCGCYVNAGWTQLAKEVDHAEQATIDGRCSFLRADLENIAGAKGHLLFANMAENGELIVPPAEVDHLGYLVRMFLGKLQHSRQLGLNPHKVFQVQVFAMTGRELTAEERAELEQLFLNAYGFVQKQLAETYRGEE